MSFRQYVSDVIREEVLPLTNRMVDFRNRQQNNEHQVLAKIVEINGLPNAQGLPKSVLIVQMPDGTRREAMPSGSKTMVVNMTGTLIGGVFKPS